MKYILVPLILIISAILMIVTYLIGLLWHLNGTRAYEFSDPSDKAISRFMTYNFPNMKRKDNQSTIAIIAGTKTK